ncbi:hypothetical protein EMPS_04597 [Entomortierella parvispora]|uniref:Uncharacterized protein n=1 Tax=Entomortierella parvispora TaxID=205924 RepID=A0A9P3H8U4_9FUNG|nr:hypothetical protein EMPS_04597 [Entomortierella parvispora]
MRFSLSASVAAFVALASVTHAQEPACSAILTDYTPGVSGAYQKCFTDQVYNTALAAQTTPDYKDLITSVCSKTACSQSTLASAESKYIAACNSSMIAEGSNGNVLQLGKNALDVFFAEPIRAAFCELDPNAPAPPVTTPPTVAPPSYCLAASIAVPANRFVSQLAVYLTSGSVRASQSAFFTALDPTEVCSDCSQGAMNSTIEYLASNLMPAVGPFYTPEFVQYWTKAVPAYNTLCKTSFTQTWPEGTLNVTVPGVPVPSPTSASLPSSTGATTAAPSPTHTNGAGSLKPAAAVATAMMMVVAALL